MSARIRGRRAALALAVLAAALALGIWALVVRADDAAATDAGCPGVDYAPRLASDRGTPPTQTLDARGRYVPVIMVHGWTSQATHTRARTGTFSHLIDLSTSVGYKPPALRSLVGQLQKIPCAAVYTFDYHDSSSLWVDDVHLGPALGAAIDCLYARTGEKVIVVAHSLGGLITRYAVTRDHNERAKRVSTLVTFGTPQTGSLLARAAAGVIDSDPRLALLRIILAECGARTAPKIETGTLCDNLPAPIRAFRGPAGEAMQVGSQQLRELPEFPSSITTLDALAGETTIKVPDMGWFAAPWDTKDVNLGDVIVTSGSATSTASHTKIAHCAYQASLVRGATDQLALHLGQVSAADVAQPLWKVVGPCFHTNLMRTQELTTEATAVIDEDISNRPANAAPQPAPTPKAEQDDTIPVCRDYKDMKKGEREVVLRRMQEDHHDTLPQIVVKASVAGYCALNPGRHIDGIYAPGSKSNPSNGGEGPLPSCSEWRELDDAASDAALLRLARQRGDEHPDIHTLRLVVGVYCKFKPDHPIGDAPG